MKQFWGLVALALLWSSPGFAQTYPYEPAVVTLQGTILMAPGETADGRKLTYPALKLYVPITVRGRGDPPTEGNLDLLHVALNETTSAMFKGLSGERVDVTGTLFHSDNANHQTRVLIAPSLIVATSGDAPSPVAKNIDASRREKPFDEQAVLVDRAAPAARFQAPDWRQLQGKFHGYLCSFDHPRYGRFQYLVAFFPGGHGAVHLTDPDGRIGLVRVGSLVESESEILLRQTNVWQRSTKQWGKTANDLIYPVEHRVGSNFGLVTFKQDHTVAACETPVDGGYERAINLRTQLADDLFKR